MNGIKLKPCPFCGGIGELERKTECGGHGLYIEDVCIRCTKCGASGGYSNSWNDNGKRLEEIAIERWERRTTDGKAD
jgi:hypothetical protein